MEVNQGDIFWVPLTDQNETESGFVHPHVVIQEDAINRSRIGTVVVVALTTNLKRANLPGNVLLEAGEAGLPRQSIVIVSQVSTVEKAQLGEYIGSLSKERVDQILAGMRFVQRISEHTTTRRNS
jgi:mRNA interferase MazF